MHYIVELSRKTTGEWNTLAGRSDAMPTINVCVPERVDSCRREYLGQPLCGHAPDQYLSQPNQTLLEFKGVASSGFAENARCVDCAPARPWEGWRAAVQFSPKISATPPSVPVSREPLAPGK